MRHPTARTLIAAATAAITLTTATPALAVTEGSSLPATTITNTMQAVQDAVNEYAPLPVKLEINKWRHIRIAQGNHHQPYGVDDLLRDAFTPASEFEYSGYVLLFA